MSLSRATIARCSSSATQARTEAQAVAQVGVISSNFRLPFRQCRHPAPTASWEGVGGRQAVGRVRNSASRRNSRTSYGSTGGGRHADRPIGVPLFAGANSRSSAVGCATVWKDDVAGSRKSHLHLLEMPPCDAFNCFGRIVPAIARGKREFLDHLAVEERDGNLYAVGVRLDAETRLSFHEALSERRRRHSLRLSGVPISDRTSWALDDALNAAAQAAGENMPVALFVRVRLKRCARCDKPFIGLSAVRLCSDECRVAGIRETQAKQYAKRRDRRPPLVIACRECGQPVSSRPRASRAFCSDACGSAPLVDGSKLGMWRSRRQLHRATERERATARLGVLSRKPVSGRQTS